MAVTLLAAVLSIVSIGGRAADAIVGGEEAPAGAYPAMVSIRFTPPPWPFPDSPVAERHHCGGTLVAPQVVLTAKHCQQWAFPFTLPTNQPVDRFAAVVGGTPLDMDPAAEDRHDIVAIEGHPEADIALWMLATSSSAPPQRLDLGTEHLTGLKSGHDPIFVGYGSTLPSGYGDPSNVLMHGTGAYAHGPNCVADIGGPNPVVGAPLSLATHTCTSYEDGGVNQCLKDSGGPLLVETDDGQLVQVSVFSWVAGNDGICDGYGVQARVSPYIDWMQDVIDGWDLPVYNPGTCESYPYTYPATPPPLVPYSPPGSNYEILLEAPCLEPVDPGPGPPVSIVAPPTDDRVLTASGRGRVG
jgi:hypothetical protein